MEARKNDVVFQMVCVVIGMLVVIIAGVYVNKSFSFHLVFDSLTLLLLFAYTSIFNSALPTSSDISKGSNPKNSF